MMLIKKFFLFSVCLLACHTTSQAQTYQTFNVGMNNWYFGNTPNAIKFNRVTAIPTTVSTKQLLGTGGSATASNPTNANLLFYTDGNNVYDATNLLMPTGSGLLGNTSSNQPVAICPVPGQNGKYFVFTNSATNTAPGSITYDVVDMNLFGNSLFPSIVPYGDVETPLAPGVLHTSLNLNLNNRSEAMLIVPHLNGTDYWLLTKDANSQNYAATLINAASYNTTHTGAFTTNISSGIGVSMSASHFAYNIVSGSVAVAPTSPNVDATTFTFNRGTGFFNGEVRLVNSASKGTNSQGIYDIEWSGDGHYVYYSVFGDETVGLSGNVFQFDFLNTSTTIVSALPATTFRSYGLQLAPDSSIYHIYQNASGGPFLIGKLGDPDSVATKINYMANAFPSIVDWKAMQFTAVLPPIKPVITLTFISAGNCQNSPTSFYPTVTPGADSLVWDFGDGNPTVNAWSPVHTYQSSGSFSVKATAYSNGQPQLPPTTNSVTINAFPITLQLVSDTTACTFEFPPPKGTSGPPQFSVTVKAQGGTPTSYVWSNGQTGATLKPDSAGYYYVVASNGSGCSAYAGVNVKEYGVQDQRRNVWYFGNHAGIDFNPTTQVALSNGAMNAPEGCSAMSDRNGEILFYTDGNSVWDQTHTMIATGIGGSTNSTESVLIVPVPGDETLYYIFTTEAKENYPSNTVYYSLFDLKQNGGLGAVVQQKVMLYSGSTERLASNGNWLITHEYGNNSFRCFQITANGIGDPVITSIGSDHSYTSPTEAEGYLKISSNGNVAVPLSIPGTSNIVEVFHFSDSTGMLSNYRKVDLNEPVGQAYGVEFSPGGNKLFVSVKGSPTPSEIFEYSIDSINHLHFKQKVSNNSEIGAIQNAPDGQTYFAINGSSSLGSITVNEDTTALSTFNFSGFALAAGTNSTLGLPSFVQSTGNQFGGPAMSVASVCLGSPMNYVATPTDPIDTFLWGFGDGGTDNQISGAHNYAAAGTYTVTLLINNRCLIHDGTPPYSLKQDIKVIAPPAKPTNPPSSAICTGTIILDAGPVASGQTYLWTTTATTETISVNTPGSYMVTVTDPSGCTSTATTNVTDARPPVDLGPDQTRCQVSGSVILLDAGNPSPAYNHTWSTGSTLQTETANISSPGITVYSVTVTNVATNCSASDAITVKVTESPILSLAVTNTTSCTSNTGKIDLTISPLTATIQPPTHTFTVFGIGPTLLNQNVGTISFPNLAAGSYSVSAIDEISGCSNTRSGVISDPSNTTTAPNQTTCTTIGISFTTNANTAPAASLYSYKIFDSSGALVDSKTNQNATNLTTIKKFAPGSYTLQITQNGTNCVSGPAGSIVISQSAQSVFNLTQNACLASPTITASNAAATYTWSGANAPSTANIQGATNLQTLTLKPTSGTFTYNVTGTDGAFCPTTKQSTIKLEANPSPSIGPFTPCANPATLSALPSTGTWTYQWYKNGVIDATLSGKQISLSPNGTTDNYQVELVSSVTGCSYKSSPATPVQIVAPILAGINSTPACDDGNPFTVTSSTDATSPTYIWYLNQGAGFNVITGASGSSITNTKAGIYKVDITDGPCTSSASITIILSPLPAGNLPNQAIICDDPKNVDIEHNHVDLDPGVFVAYDWFMKKTSDSPEASLASTSQTYTAAKKGIYRVELTNTFGCKASDITEVLNDCVPKIIAPNAFRPASSVSENTNFFAKTFHVNDDNFYVYIFNRWGELIYESNKIDFQWNGGYNNDLSRPLPSGAYAYIIKYISSYRPDEGVQEKRGGVMLLR